jgi:cytidylate kinase
MAARVVTIARTLGAAGEEVAEQVAAALGFQYIDHGVIDRAVEISGADPETIERAEGRKSLVNRMLDSLAGLASTAGDGGIADLPGEVVYVVQSASTTAQRPSVPYTSYESLIRGVIDEIADEGNVVIVAHGAAMRLSKRDDVVRVLVTASPETRASRVASDGGMDARAAERAIQDSDRWRVEYLRRFYDVQEELPTHYDLVVSTDALSAATAAALIVAAAQA